MADDKKDGDSHRNLEDNTLFKDLIESTQKLPQAVSKDSTNEGHIPVELPHEVPRLPDKVNDMLSSQMDTDNSLASDPLAFFKDLNKNQEMLENNQKMLDKCREILDKNREMLENNQKTLDENQKRLDKNQERLDKNQEMLDKNQRMLDSAASLPGHETS